MMHSSGRAETSDLHMGVPCCTLSGAHLQMTSWLTKGREIFLAPLV